MSDVYIISACRTAIGERNPFIKYILVTLFVGSFQGQFEKFSASDLGSTVITEALTRANLEPTDVDQTILGQVLTAGQGQNPARQAAVGAKIPYSSPAYTVNMLCGSGLKYSHSSIKKLNLIVPI